MPLILDKNIGLHGRLTIWQVGETLDDIPHSVARTIAKIKRSKRHVELIGEYFLKELLNLEGKIDHLPNGKPVLAQGEISISHGEDLVGILTLSQNAGLDIQMPTEKILRIDRKFCNDPELELVREHTAQLELTTLIWSAKEAIFKVYGQDMPFADGMKISGLEKNVDSEGKMIPAGKFKCDVFDGNTFELEYFTLDACFVVHTIG